MSRLLAWCDTHGVGVVPQGGRTGLAGGAVSKPGEVVLSLARMDRVEAVDEASRVAVAEAGVTLERLQEAAAAHGLEPGIDTASRGSATIGGLVSTNAGGIRAFRHGVMRHRILGLEAVLADGTVMSDMTGVMKVSAGLDAKQIFVGAEGILGVVTRAVIRLEPLASARATALVGLRDLGKAVALAAALDRPGEAGTLLAAELMTKGFAEGSARAHGLDPSRLGLGAAVSLVIEIGAASEAAARDALEARLAAAMEEGGIEGAVFAETLSQRDQIWLVREASDAMGRAYGLELWYDVSVPLAHLDTYLAGLPGRLARIDPALECHAIGHLADGNLHVMVARRVPSTVPHAAIEAALYEGLAALGGSFSAEHGVGLDKRDALSRYGDPGKLALMRRLKAALDPNGTLNPGKVLTAG